jgi:phosphoglucomutase
MQIYLEYGFAYQDAVSVVKPGKSGADEIKQMMEDFRNTPPSSLGGSPVVCVKDFKTLKMVCNGVESTIDMPATSNVLQWFTESGTKISVRPSGTEPKIKFYIEVKGEMGCPKCYDSAVATAKETVAAIKKDLKL